MWRELHLSDLVAAKAIPSMVIDHAGGLHERVADCGADEAEAATLQVLAHDVRFTGACGDTL